LFKTALGQFINYQESNWPIRVIWGRTGKRQDGGRERAAVTPIGWLGSEILTGPERENLSLTYYLKEVRGVG